MDPDLSRWVLEFLMRQPVPGDFIQRALTLMPVSDQDSRFKKTILLRTIQDQARAGSVIPEEVLENLERVEELDRLDGVGVIRTMKGAYCAVAVYCTMRYAGDGEDMEGEFFAAVRRIWRGKVGRMEGKSELFSDELAGWRDEIEAAVVDEDARRYLLTKMIDVDDIAFSSVKDYVEEAWGIMGPSFLESAASVMGGVQASSPGSRRAGLSTASEDGLTRDLGVNDGGGIELGDQTVNEGVVGGLSDHEVVETAAGSHDLGEGSGGDGSDRVVGGLRDHEVPHKVGEIASGSHDPGKVSGSDGSDRVEMTSQEEVRVLGDKQVADNVVQGVESLYDFSQDLDSGKDDSPEQGRGLGNKEVDEFAGKMAVNSSRKKHASRRLCIRRGGSAIADTEDSDSDMPSPRNDPLPSPEIRQVREALKSSNMELQAMVKDPLPDVLLVSETVRCELQKKHMSDTPSIQNQNGADAVKEPIPDIKRKKPMNDTPSVQNQKGADVVKEPVPDIKRKKPMNDTPSIQNQNGADAVKEPIPDIKRKKPMNDTPSVQNQKGADVVKEPVPDIKRKKPMNDTPSIQNQNGADAVKEPIPDIKRKKPMNDTPSIQNQKGADVVKEPVPDIKRKKPMSDTPSIQNQNGADAVKEPIPDIKRKKPMNDTPSIQNQNGADAVKEPVPDIKRKKHMNDTLSVQNQNGADVEMEPIPDIKRNDEPVQNQNRVDAVEKPIPDIARNKEPVQADEANATNQKNSVRPGLMERNSTAHTYEWDSVDSDSSEGPTNGRKRFHLPTPDRIVNSPLQTVDSTANHPKKRRKKKFSVLEEDTLRTGVHLYGKGNWKVILTKYSDIFDERTTIDLKDKWRNMTKD